MTSNPKFSIGEEVILWVEEWRELCGTGVTVTDRVFDKRQHIKEPSRIITGWFYWVTPDLTGGHPWSEGALRPKPKGAGQSLTEFMEKVRKTSLKIPVEP